MARLPQFLKSARSTAENVLDHGFHRLPAQPRKTYRARADIKLPTDYGEFELQYFYRSVIDGVHHLALVKGQISPKKLTLVRVHSECLTGDVFGSLRCDCGN